SRVPVEAAAPEPTSPAAPPAAAESPAPEKTDSAPPADAAKTTVVSSTTPAAPQPAAPSPSQAPAAAAASHEQLAVEVEIHALTWIKISADGMPVQNGELQPGTTKRFTAQTSINVVVGNAGGLSMKVNDKPVRPLGGSGQVRSLTITAENLPSI